ncbi:MAG: hypothetical protein II352_08880 [Selenomonadaceae bacterium]|nr:hypothetical protein [Selenomonadaceae bacterium]
MTAVLDNSNGLVNPKVLCTIELEDGSILAGTDGGGIYRVRNGKVEKNYGKKHGLTSEVVMRIIKDNNGSGLFILSGGTFSTWKIPRMRI